MELRRRLLVLASCLACTNAFVLPGGCRQVVLSRPGSVRVLTPLASTKSDATSPETPRDPDEIIVEGDFEDDTIKPSLSSLLEDGPLDGVDDLDTLRALDADADDGFFGIPDYVPSELPDLAALGAGLERRREAPVGGYDVDNEEMYKELELDDLTDKIKEYIVENIDEPGERVLIGRRGLVTRHAYTPRSKDGVPVDDPAYKPEPVVWLGCWHNIQPYKVYQAKKEAAAKWRTHDKDVGSSDVQVAQLTLTILHLTKHVQQNPRDHSTRRGLIAAVNARRRHLNYVYRKNPEKGREMAAAFGIRFKPPGEVRSKFEMYRNFRNTKSKAAKNLQAAAAVAEASS